MKVAILSMQEVKNYGSFLQAWSLKRNIECLGHSVDFVNILPGEQIGEYKQSKLDKIKKIVSRLCGFDFLKRLKTIRTFQNRFSKEFILELGVRQGEENKNHYDFVVIGSDEVFNCAQKTWFGFSPQLFGYGLNADKVISYAGSFGATDCQKLKDIGKDLEVASYLRNLSQISVRDDNSSATITELLGVVPQMHVDPVLIYDYDSDIANQISKYDKSVFLRYGINPNEYMIVYTYPGRISDPKEIEAIRQYAVSNHLKLISIGHYFGWCDNVVVPHPFEVLEIFRNAKCIVTDTFHGSVFSIKYNKQFCTIIRGMNSNKLSFLLRQFGLEDRIAHDPPQINSILQNPIDYQHVNRKLQSEKQRSIDYLSQNFHFHNKN